MPNIPTAAPAAPLPLALTVAIVVGAGLAFLPAVLNDGDTYLHIRAGMAMLDSGAILHVDPFSATRAGQPWQTHEWLAQVAFGAVYRYAGLAGVLLMTALAGAIAVFQMTRAIGRSVEPAYAVLLVALGVLLAAPSLLARPHVLVLPLLTTVLTEALDAAENRRRPRLWLIVPALWLWANMHGSFVIGLALIGLGGLEALLAAFRRDGARAALGEAVRWGLVGVAALAAVIAGPHGLQTLIFPLTHSSSPALARIGEWQPLDLTQPNAFAAVVAALILVLSRGVVVAPTRIVAVLGLMLMAVLHVRHLLLLGVIAPVLLAPAIGQLRPATATTPARRPLALAVVVMLGLAAVAARLIWPPAPQDAVSTPVSAVAAVPEALRHRPVLNDYAFGAYLVFADVPPVIDSRVELYGSDAIADYARIVTERCRLARALHEHDAAWTIFAPQNPAVARLDSLPGWTRLYADRIAVVHRRNEPPAPPPGDCLTAN